jgi:ubiquinone/menaquinone biosynthesis C-methylase UbiE
MSAPVAHEQFSRMDPSWWDPEALSDGRRHVWRRADNWCRLQVDVNAAEVLDAGCGRGRTTARLAQYGHGVTAIDTNQEMLAITAHRLAHKGLSARLVQSSVVDMPFSCGEFDVSLGVLVSEHVPDLEAMIAELARVTKPGGQVIATATQPQSLYSLWTTKLNPELRRSQAEWPRSRYTWRRLQSALTANGLQIERRAGFGVVPPISLRRDWEGQVISPEAADKLSRDLDWRLDGRLGIWFGHVVAVSARK